MTYFGYETDVNDEAEDFNGSVFSDSMLNQNDHHAYSGPQTISTAYSSIPAHHQGYAGSFSNNTTYQSYDEPAIHVPIKSTNNNNNKSAYYNRQSIQLDQSDNNQQFMNDSNEFKQHQHQHQVETNYCSNSNNDSGCCKKCGKMHQHKQHQHQHHHHHHNHQNNQENNHHHHHHNHQGHHNHKHHKHQHHHHHHPHQTNQAIHHHHHHQQQQQHNQFNPNNLLANNPLIPTLNTLPFSQFAPVF